MCIITDKITEICIVLAVDKHLSGIEIQACLRCEQSLPRQ
jgi:hypothetical protein